MQRLQSGRTSPYRVVAGGAVGVPALLGGDGARGGATTVPPTFDPGWFVGRSVPEALGKLFVVFGVDSLEPPAGGFWVVVSGFCASAGTAPRMANARVRAFIIGGPSLVVDIKPRRTGRVPCTPHQCRTHPFYRASWANPAQTDQFGVGSGYA